MNAKTNERCPLQSECERKCAYIHREGECDYYIGNNRPGCEIPDQKGAGPDYEAWMDADDSDSAPEAARQMVYIEVSKIKPHPNNPRKELGDLTELAESIKANGILQNLTVVPSTPGYCPTCKLYSYSKCEEGYDKTERAPCTKWESKGNFTVVIGHRRLAAAKLAGLTEVPCVISDMPLADQIRTMLMENIQRSDLTPYEQAQGFQMMLDLGETVNDIAQKTGFSKTTVYSRVKMLELDPEKFKASGARGATIWEYTELEKIKSIDRKNEVLEHIGTDNFKYKLKQAIDAEAAEARRAEWITLLSEFATQVDNDSGYAYAGIYYTSNKPSVERPDDADTVSYFFFVSNYGYIRLMKERSGEQQEDAEERARREQEAAKMTERRNQLEAATKRAYELRREFVTGVSKTVIKKNLADILTFSLWVRSDSYGDVDLSELFGLMDMELELDEDEMVTYDAVREAVASAPERTFWMTTYYDADDGARNGYFANWKCEHQENENLDRLYALLTKLGYKMSDEERALRDGTHELFLTAKEAPDNEE